MKNLIFSIFLLLVAACASVPATTVTKTEPPKARYIFSDKNGLYGLLDENGNEIVPAQYLYIDIVKEGMIPAFTIEKEFVFLDETGRKYNGQGFLDKKILKKSVFYRSMSCHAVSPVFPNSEFSL